MTSELEPGQRRVFVVDDDSEMVELIRLILTQAGHCVRGYTRPAEALVEAEAAPPDLILLDLMMPAMDGWEFIRQMRGLPALAKVPVVLVTARAQQGDRDRADATPEVRAYITKPFGPAALLATVAAATR